MNHDCRFLRQDYAFSLLE